MVMTEEEEWGASYLASVNESGRKDLTNPILYISKWWARRLMTPFSYAIDRMQRYGGLPVNLADAKGWDGVSGGGTIPFVMARKGIQVYSSDINPIAVDLQIGAKNLILNYETIEVNLDRIIKSVEDECGHLYELKNIATIPSDSMACYTYYIAKRWCEKCSSKKHPSIGGVICRHHTESGGLVVCSHCNEMQRVQDYEYECNNCGKKNKASKSKYKNCADCDAKFKPNSEHAIDYIPMWAKWYSRKEKTSGYCQIQEEMEYQNKDSLPAISVSKNGYNTEQIYSHGFKVWKELLLDRQKILFSTINNLIESNSDCSENDKVTLSVMMRGLLEYNSILCEPKGLGTGHIRHAFHNHVLHPKSLVCEPTPFKLSRQSGSFNTVLKKLKNAKNEIISPSIMTRDGKKVTQNLRWDCDAMNSMEITVSAAENMNSMNDEDLDIAAFDIPYFDSVMYDELSNYFRILSTKNSDEEKNWIQVNEFTAVSKGDTQSDADKWGKTMSRIFTHVHKKLKPEGRFLISYHHSKKVAWTSLAGALKSSGFVIEDWFPIWAEMGTSSSHSKTPIRIDLMMIFKKNSAREKTTPKQPLDWIKHIEQCQGNEHWKDVKKLNEKEIECINQMKVFLDDYSSKPTNHGSVSAGN